MNPDPTVEFWRHPDLPFIESRRASQSRVCYKSHSHPTFSIGAVDQGLSQFSSYFAENCLIKAGTVVVIPAEVEHSCNPMPDFAWSYQMMHLDADWLSELFYEFVDAPFVDLGTKNVTKISPFILENRVIYQAFCKLNDCLFDQQLNIYEKEQHLIEVLTEILLPNFDFKTLQLTNYFQKEFLNLVEYIQQSEHFLSLDQLADFSKISRYAIIRLFKNHQGMTPHAYQLNLKVNRARELLKKGQNIVDVAQALDFVDQSHFHRTFKQFTGITPKQYQESSRHRLMKLKISRNFIQS